jgi:hypothetical protein
MPILDPRFEAVLAPVLSTEPLAFSTGPSYAVMSVLIRKMRLYHEALLLSVGSEGMVPAIRTWPRATLTSLLHLLCEHTPR